MTDVYIGQIKMFGGNFAPRGYTFADGQLLQVAQNTALFSLYGTTYGGDGRTTFGVPNLQGRGAMHPGRGPGLTSRRLGQKGGEATVTLTDAQMPNHNHGLFGNEEDGDEQSPADATFGRNNDAFRPPTGATLGNMADGAGGKFAIQKEGGGQAHNNWMPYQVVNFIVAVTGLSPSRG